VFELMRAGALDVTAKPRGGLDQGTSADYLVLARKIRVAAGVSVFRRSATAKGLRARADQPAKVPGSPIIRPAPAIKIVALGASTGGPTALLEVLSKLPRPLSVPLVGVQHIADGFLPGLARWLGESSGIRVEIAESAQSPRPGVFYLAPTNLHLTFDAQRRFVLTDGPHQVGAHRPSIDRLFESIAARYGRNGLAILLTGMGRDGADGMGAVFRAGGMTMAQDASSCVVSGMPEAAICAGHVQQVLPLAAIGPAIAKAVTKAPPNKA
jgi:two-component system chemotaxis response regulator CheB